MKACPGSPENSGVVESMKRRYPHAHWHCMYHVGNYCVISRKRGNLSMDFQKELEKLERAGVIDSATASRIQEYYRGQAGESGNRLFAIFGVLGAVLSALGIILLLAHNWEEIPKSLKTVISLMPLLLGQLACLFAWKRKRGSRGWVEATAVFLSLSCGASIALISQVYHLPGETHVFVFTWLLCAAPVVLLTGSSMSSLLFIAGATWYGLESVMYDHQQVFPWLYLAALAIPAIHYTRIARLGTDRNLQGFHHWFFPISLLIMVAVLTENKEELMLMVYAALAGVLLQIGRLGHFNSFRLRANGFLVLGSLTTVVVLLIASFSFPWEAYVRMKTEFPSWLISTEFLALLILVFTALSIHTWNRLMKGVWFPDPVDFVYVLLPALLLLPVQGPGLPRILANLMVFAVGLGYVLKGNREERIGIMNYGLVLIAALIICRYFDTEISFIVKGLLFIAIGAGFFFANYHFISKRKKASA